jgi:TolB-like protein/Flp pilus assembly protein TadD
LPIVLLALIVYGLRDRFSASPSSEKMRIAVLPLTDASPDVQDSFFADGMTEMLITELGKIRALQVTAHQTVNRYRQSTKTHPEIARELNVDALLVATVFHSRGRVRINAKLVSAATGRQLWSHPYEFDLQDVLRIEGVVARDVASQIRITVTPQEQARLTHSRRIDPDVSMAYMLALKYLRQEPMPGNWKKAKEYFEKAIAGDESFAKAYAGLAELHLRARGSPFKRPAELRRQAREWAQQALRQDETVAEAHTVLARAAQQEREWALAEAEYLRAIAANPSYETARVWYAMFLYGMGQFDEAVLQAERAQELAPDAPFINTWAAAAFLFAGKTEQGNAALRTALDMDPRYTDANIVRARDMVVRGSYDQAIAELQDALNRSSQREPLLLGALAHALGRAGRHKEALKLVDELQRIEAAAGQQYVPPFGLIWAYAGLGENDNAMRGLKQAFEEGSDRIMWLRVDPFLDPLRSDSAFVELVQRAGFPANPSKSQ